MKKTIIITIGIVMVALIGLAVAGPHWHGGKSAEDRIDYVKHKLTKTLALNETQTATLDRMAEDILAEHDRMEIRRGDFKARFFEVLNQDSVTPEELARLFEEKKPDIDRLMQLAAGHIAEFHSMLTPEQRAQFITELENHHRGCRFAR